jgi:hypothetical protein
MLLVTKGKKNLYVTNKFNLLTRYGSLKIGRIREKFYDSRSTKIIGSARMRNTNFNPSHKHLQQPTHPHHNLSIIFLHECLFE